MEPKRDHRDRARLDQHVADDERLAPDPIGQPAGHDLADRPDRGVGRREEADLAQGQARADA